MAEVIKGLTVEIGGDVKPLNKALAEVNKNTKALQNELKFVNKALELDPSNTEMLAQKQTLLKELIVETTQKLQTLNRAQAEADAKMAAGLEVDQKEYRRLQREIALTEGALSSYHSQCKLLMTETEKLTSAISEQEQELSQMKARYTDIVLAQGKNSAEAKALAKDISSLSTEIAENRGRLNEATAAADKYDKSLDEAADGAKRAEGGFSALNVTLGNLVSEAIVAGLRQIGNLTKELVSSVFETGMTFEASMSKVAALSGATGDELKVLTQTAKDYGASTKFSASEAAEALQYMALAGWNTQQMTSGLGGVLNLAAASGMELGAACDIVTDYLSAFNMEAAQSTELADMMAYAQANANLTVEQLAEAYRNSAANLNAAGQSVETVTSLLSMMANQGLKGSAAGTALSAVMRDITNSMEDGSIKIGETTVAVMDANGNFRDLIDILGDVEAATEGMGSAERAAALSTAFTAESTKGLNLMLNAGIDEAAAFSNELNNVGGAAADMAATMSDNLAGAWDEMESALEGIQINLYECFSDTLKNALLDAIPLVNELGDGLVGIAEGAEGADEQIASATSGLIEMLTDMIFSALPAISAALVGLISGLLSGLTEALPELGGLLSSLLVEVVNLAVSALPDLTDAALVLVLSFATDLLAALPSLVTSIVSAVPQLIDTIISFTASKLIPALPVIVTSLIGGLLAETPQIVAAGIQLLTSLTAAMPDILLTITEAIPLIINDGILTPLIDSLPLIIQAGIDLLVALIQELPLIITSICSAMPKLVSSIASAIVSNIDKIILAGVQLLVSLTENLPLIIKEIIKAAPQIVSALVSAFGSLLSEMVSIGSNLVSGIWQGISGSFTWIKNKLRSWTGNVLSYLKGLFGIASPSKVMRDEVGHWLGEGSAEGITEDADSILGATQDIIDDMNRLDGANIHRNIDTTFGTTDDTALMAAISLQGSIDRLTELVGEYLPQLASASGKDILLDGRKLVGGLIDQIDTQLADRYAQKARGTT